MFEELIEKLRKQEPFSFARYGDGEWNSLLNIDGESYKNTDGHTYFKDMGEALANVLKSKPKYFLGMQRFAKEERYPDQINNFIADNGLNDLNWINADIFHHASIKGYFEQFFDVLSKADDPVVLVGPPYLSGLIRFYNLHLEIPEKNCWLEVKNIVSRVKKLLYLNPYVVVLFVASMPANVMIDELYNEFGDKHTFIDCGSVFDPYVGKATRSYHKKVIDRLKQKV